MNWTGWTAPALVAGGAVLSLVWVALSAQLPGRWATGQHHLPHRSLDLLLDHTVRRHAGRVTAGVALACLASLWFDAFRLHWVVVTAMAILQGAHDRSFALVRVVQRVLGTLLGLVLFEGVLQLQPYGAALVGLVMVLQFAVEAATLHYMLGLLFITPLALTLATFGQELYPHEHHERTPARYLAWRSRGAGGAGLPGCGAEGGEAFGGDRSQVKWVVHAEARRDGGIAEEVEALGGFDPSEKGGSRGGAEGAEREDQGRSGGKCQSPKATHPRPAGPPW